jgi:hypothetical protein
VAKLKVSREQPKHRKLPVNKSDAVGMKGPEKLLQRNLGEPVTSTISRLACSKRNW